jgi:hypothetical protein
MVFQIAELLSLFGFFLIFGKLQFETNNKIDTRIDGLEIQQARILTAQEFMITMLSDRLEVFEQKLNFINAKLHE